MNRLVLAALATGTVSLPAAAALTQGAGAPDFTAPASLAGKAFTFSLAEARRKGPVVVYFYPAAYTGGCNVQARTFATSIDKFAEAGASVVGVSLDDIETLNAFSADPEYCGGKLPVASDADGSISRRYELKVADAREGMKDTRGQAIEHGFAERTTFIVTPDGKIAATVGGVSPKENVEQALAIVQRLARATPAKSAGIS